MQNQQRTTSRFLLLAWAICFCFSSSLFSQEICNNGIDDDGNGLTDFEEEICDCSGMISTTIVADFEDYSCCPQNWTGADTGIGCLTDGWQSVNPSPDYYNICGYMGGDGILPDVPLPFPSGDGIIGFATVNGYAEYVGVCLEYSMLAGETYDIEFYIGFQDDPTIGIASDYPFDFGVFGASDCDVMNNSGGGCLTNNGWIELASELVDPGMDSTWVQVNLTITPSDDICAFSIGTGCASINAPLNYHYLDNISITGDFGNKDAEIPEITQSGNCIDGITLEVDEPNGLVFQWYLDGIAIPGADGSSLALPAPFVAGEYAVYVDYGTNCSTSPFYTADIDFNVLDVEGEITNSLCAGDDLAEIDINTPTQNSPFDIIWDNGETGNEIYNLEDGDYEVTVTDANGCFGTEIFSVISPPILDGSVIDIIHPTQNNPFGSATAVGSGGTSPYFYTWSSGELDETDDMLAPGTYTITVTDENNCTTEVEVVINPDLIANTIVSHETCFEDCDGSIELLIEGGIPDYTIVWNEGTGLIENFLCPDDFHITITDDVGTELIIDIDILGNDEIDIQATLGGDLCEGDESGFIDLIVQGGTPDYQYQWSNNDTVQNLMDIPPGDYFVTITDALGCTAEEDYTIAAIPPFTYEYNTIDAGCGGVATGAVNLDFFVGNAPFDFIWSNGEITQSITNLTSGIYTVTISDNANCNQVASFTVNEDSDLLVVETITNISCPANADGSISLDISGGLMPFMINWTSLGQSGTLVENLAAGDYPVEILDANGCLWNGIFTIQAEEAVTVIENISDVICLCDNSGSIDITVSGGNVPYQFLWSNSEITEDISDLVQGDYNVIITDALDCQYNFDFSVQEGYTFSVDAQLKNAGCAQAPTGAIDITLIDGVAPFSFLWSNGEITEDLIDIPSGNYSVTITDDNNCQLIQSFMVPQDSDLEISSVVMDTRCPDSVDGNIDITINSVTGPFQFLWSNGEITEDISNLDEDTYSVTVTDVNNCQLTQNFDIISPEAPNYQIDTTNPDCEIPNGSITISSSMINELNFSWSNGLMASMINNLEPDMYFVTITDLNDCEYYDEVTLTENDCDFTIDVSNSEIACDDVSIDISVIIEGGNAPYDYELVNTSSGTFFNGTFTNNPFIISNLEAGEYFLELTSDNDLVTSTTFIITQISNPILFIQSLTDFNGFDIDCFDGTTGSILATITDGLPPYQILWSNGNDTQQIDNLPSGTYDVTITDDNNCSAEASITLIQPEQLILDFTYNDPSCIDPLSGQIEAFASGGVPDYNFGYNGNIGTTDGSFTNLPADAYDITVSDMNGCATSSFIELVPPNEISVDLGEDFTIYLGDPASIEAILNLGSATLETIVWTGIPDTLCPNCTLQEFFPTETQSYNVVITDSNGCTATASVTIRVEIKINDIYVANIFSPNNDGINEWFFPQTNLDDNQIIDYMYIFDRWGNRVFTNETFLINQEQQGWNGRVKDNQVTPGVYAYILAATLPNGKLSILKGNVTLVE